MKPLFQVYFIVWLFCCVGFTSCMTYRYQHVETTWIGMDTALKSIKTPDQMLTVMPRMGNTDGKIMCAISNRSDSTLYIYPYYSFAVMPSGDTIFLNAARLYSIIDSTMSYAFDREILYESETEAMPFPVPPKGTLKWVPGAVNNYIGLSRASNNPAPSVDKNYSEWGSPYHIKINTAYALASDSVLRVSKTKGYISTIHPWRHYSGNVTPDKFKKLPNDFYVYEQQTSGFTVVMTAILVATIAVLAGGEE